MSNTSIALIVGATVLTVGGVVAYAVVKKKAKEEAPTVAQSGGAGAPTAASAAAGMSPGEALAIIGGKALQEGIKYYALGGAGYAANLAGRGQKAS